MSSTLRLTHDACFTIQDDAIELFVRLATREGNDIINVTLTDDAAFFFERQSYVYHYANEPTTIVPEIKTMFSVVAKTAPIDAETKTVWEGDLRGTPTGMLTLGSAPVK